MGRSILGSLFFFLCSTLCLFPALAQRQIEIVQANNLTGVRKDGLDLRKLSGNCIFRQDDVFLACDTAWLDATRNALEAKGNVRITRAPALKITGTELYYTGNDKLALLTGGVVLQDEQGTLTTPSLRYNVQEGRSYFTRGGVLTNGENTLSSPRGVYDSNQKQARFSGGVYVEGQEYCLFTDTLDYGTATGISYFFGPTVILHGADTLFCQEGSYDTRRDIAHFTKRSIVHSQERELRADTLYFENKSGYGRARGRVRLHIKKEDMVLWGSRGEFYEQKGQATFYQTPFIALCDTNGQDTTFLRAQVIKVFRDEVSGRRHFRAEGQARVTQGPFKISCDTLIFDANDSMVYALGSQWIWMDSVQISAPVVQLRLKNSSPDELFLQGGALAVEPSDTVRFNQVRGRNMNGLFHEGRLSRILVSGNGESVYYARNDSGTYMGMNAAECSDLILRIVENKMQSITFLTKPDATFYPIEQVDPKDFKLKGFRWVPQLKPADMHLPLYHDVAPGAGLAYPWRHAGNAYFCGMVEGFPSRSAR